MTCHHASFQAHLVHWLNNQQFDIFTAVQRQASALTSLRPAVRQYPSTWMRVSGAQENMSRNAAIFSCHTVGRSLGASSLSTIELQFATFQILPYLHHAPNGHLKTLTMRQPPLNTHIAVLVATEQKTYEQASTHSPNVQG